MKTLIKETKTKTYINFGGVLYVKGKAYNNRNFHILDFESLQEQQRRAIENKYNWNDLGDCSSIEEAYSEYVARMKEAAKAYNAQKSERIAKLEKEQQRAWEKLAAMDVIPTTVENVRTILLHLNGQNWGSWDLPRLSMGYSANQYDCDGIQATTIKLDKPISDEWIKNERYFKVGGKRGYLEKYQSL